MLLHLALRESVLVGCGWCSSEEGGGLQPLVKCPIGLLGWHVGIGPTAGLVLEESTRVARECTVNAMVPGEEVAKALTSRALH